MSKILKVIDNETIEIKEYVCPEAVFKSVKNPPTLTDIKNEIINFEDYCVFKEIIKPFEMYKELKRYKNIIEEIKKYVKENQEIERFDGGVRDGEDYYILYNSDIILDILNKTNKE